MLRKENERAWKVTVDDIKANGYNLDIKNPHDADTGPGDPDELLAELQDIGSQCEQTLDRLRDELAASLDSSE